MVLTEADLELHRFVWRRSPDTPLRDYHMTRLNFGVSLSSFAANMCVKCNAIECSGEFALASKAVLNCFYVDNGLTGAVSIEEAIKLQRKPQCFSLVLVFFSSQVEQQ